MFREYDLRYLIPYVVLMLTLTGLDIGYEVATRGGESWPETLLAIGNGASSAVSTTFITFATVEAVIYMVLAMWRLKKLQKDSEEKQAEARREGRAEGHEEGHEEGRVVGREEGRVEGIQQGREEGREEGIQQGREEGRGQGIQEGRREERQRLEAWVRQVEAEVRDAGVSITEPPPFDEE